MKILMFNIRGFNSAPKRTALKRLMENIGPSIILLQETMIEASTTYDLFLKLKTNWKCCALDSSGLSGYLLIAWDPLVSLFNSFTDELGLMVEGKFIGFDSSI